MSHLLDRIAAFIDGELDHAERDRVMVHLASCAACRAEVAAHRALKSRLAGLAAPVPSPALLAQIRRLAEPGEPLPPPPPPGSRGDQTTRPPTVGVGRRPAADSRERRARRSRRRVHVFASTGMLAVTATLLTAFAVGGGATPEAPPVTPDIDSYMIEHAWTTRDVPFAELPAGAVDVSFRTGTGR